MVVFLAGRDNLRIRRLHRRIKNRFQSDGRFGTVRFRVARPREPGPYRVTVDVDPRLFLDDDSYPASTARVEVGFEFPDYADHEFYWFDWIEPDRSFLLGWHRDDDHSALGPTHLQANGGDTAVDHESATVLDAHSIAVVEARLEQLPATLERVEWRDGTVVKID